MTKDEAIRVHELLISMGFNVEWFDIDSELFMVRVMPARR